MNRFMGESWIDMLDRHYRLSWYIRSKMGYVKEVFVNGKGIHGSRKSVKEIFKTEYLGVPYNAYNDD